MPNAPSSDDATFLREFEAQRWPLERWHHSDHIKLAYLYLQLYSFDEAITRIRTGIRAHNAAHHIPDQPDRGYHETITQAWLKLVEFIVGQYGPEVDSSTFVERHPELWQAKTLRLFYSRERLMSARAKAEFVEPDLNTLPRTNKSSTSPISR